MDLEKAGVVVVEGVPVDSDELREQMREEMKREVREEIGRELYEVALRDLRSQAREEVRKNFHYSAARETHVNEQIPQGPNIQSEMLGCLVLLVFTGIMLWFIYDLQAATVPENFFEAVPDCLVLNVTKEFVNKGVDCVDRFRYDFTPDQFASSVTVFSQFEEFTRADPSLCSDPDAVGLDAGRFDIGTQKQCFRLDPLAELYRPSFNCATPSPPCYTLLPVTSTHDPTAAIVVFVSPFVLVLLAFLVSWFSAAPNESR